LITVETATRYSLAVAVAVGVAVTVVVLADVADEEAAVVAMGEAVAAAALTRPLP
jgi:hypothetical protein